MKRFLVIIPAYNEEKQISRCIQGIMKAGEHCRSSYALERIIVCINGCTDKTEEVVDQLINSNLPIVKIVLVRRGYISALNALFSYAMRHFSLSYVIKIDADAVPQETSFKILLDQFNVHPSLVIVGGQPVPHIDLSLSKFRKFIVRILSARSLYPQAEVSTMDAKTFHPYAFSNPQPIGSVFEQKSKIYFHGRFWAIRKMAIKELPGSQIGDDILLAARLYTENGAGVIRLRYDAQCVYTPTQSIKRHVRVYRRIYHDLKLLEQKPLYRWYISASRTKLDWEYVASQGPNVLLLFILYRFLQTIELVYFKYTAFQREDWQYHNKKEFMAS